MKERSITEIRELPVFYAVSHIKDFPEIHFVHLDKSDEDWWEYYEVHTSTSYKGHDYKGYTHYPQTKFIQVWFYNNKEDAIMQFKHRINIAIAPIRHHETYQLEYLNKVLEGIKDKV